MTEPGSDSICLILEQKLSNGAQSLLGFLSIVAFVILSCKYLFTRLFPLLDYLRANTLHHWSLAHLPTPWAIP